MIACDVNVLVHAFNADDEQHEPYRHWLEAAAGGHEPFGLSAVVASGFIRVVTHPKVLDEPLAVSAALDLLAALRSAPAVVPLEPGPRHWVLFDDLCRRAGARGNAVPDAFLAALAIEHGCTWVTADRGFARYPGLRVRHPLES
ncbi:type II toxin-antitoxin system VapC family toxin [Actinomycetospora sp. NBRC 106378]|uniref:type II toxin-antitoxin system VapC family toxin n=1 Tax=Actinomycetospora sp. NBRC 106378 TaxID=3032208 RepID=UPI0024A1945C|nr:type II toxin-antitoxin system VapC family toxin [Actinomycetospora sp. NBRC 106378]GLZ51638.1 ribonuclease VapC43 [Actinomycetospora sp. NBRC 106378]